jgi:hypothetical protein
MLSKNLTKLGYLGRTNTQNTNIPFYDEGTPSLDLNFAGNKNLVDNVSSNNLVTFTRASSGTYVGDDGLVKTATTDEPRFDHDPVTKESLGLLVEESRTNLLLQSNGFDTTWTNTNSSEALVSGIAPDGANTVWQLTDTLDSSPVNHILNQTSVSFTSGIAYTFSVFAKAGTQSAIGLVFPSGMVGVATVGIKANLTDGTIISTGANATGSVTVYPNGWYRVSATMIATDTGTANFQIRPAPIAGTGTTYQGDGTGTIFIYGAQLEAGAFPTSYIPTTTAAVTRSADVASITETNFTSWYNQSEGTVFLNVFNNEMYTGTNRFPYPAQFDDGTNAQRISFDHSILAAGYRLQYVVRDGDVNQASMNAQTGLPTGEAKWSAAYGLDSFATSGNGGVVQTDTSGTVPIVNRLQIGAGFGNLYNGYIRRITYFPTRLSNTTLQNITK